MYSIAAADEEKVSLGMMKSNTICIRVDKFCPCRAAADIVNRKRAFVANTVKRRRIIWTKGDVLCGNSIFRKEKLRKRLHCYAICFPVNIP